MRKVITITSMVGGTGKTSLLVNLATVLTEDFGKRVLCIGLARDLEDWFAAAEPANDPPHKMGMSASEPNTLRGQPQERTPDYVILSETEAQSAQVLQQLTAREADYDYVLVEVRYSEYWVVREAFVQADLVLIAGRLNRFERPAHQRDLVAHIAPLLSENRLNPAPMRTVLSVPVPRLTGEEEYMIAEDIKRLETHYDDTYRQPDLPPVCATQIIADEEYKEALCECRPVAHSHPHSRTVQDYRALAQELLTILQDH